MSRGDLWLRRHKFRGDCAFRKLHLRSKHHGDSRRVEVRPKKQLQMRFECRSDVVVSVELQDFDRAMPRLEVALKYEVACDSPCLLLIPAFFLQDVQILLRLILSGPLFLLDNIYKSLSHTLGHVTR